MPLGRYRVAKPKLVAKKFHFFSPRVFVTPVALYNKAGDAQRPKWQGRLAASSRALANDLLFPEFPAAGGTDDETTPPAQRQITRFVRVRGEGTPLPAGVSDHPAC